MKEFILVLLFINYCNIFHLNNRKPTFAPPCITIFGLLLFLTDEQGFRGMRGRPVILGLFKLSTSMGIVFITRELLFWTLRRAWCSRYCVCSISGCSRVKWTSSLRHLPRMVGSALLEVGWSHLKRSTDNTSIFQLLLWFLQSFKHYKNQRSWD